MSDERIGRRGQIKIYFGKCYRTFLHEKGWVCLISTVIISLILGAVVGDKTFKLYEKTQYGVFAMICGCIWTGLFNSIQAICKERAIIKREHRTGLHISSYIFAHMLFDLCLCVVEGAIITIVFDILREFPSSGVVFGLAGFEFFVGFTLIIFCSDALGIMVSCIVKSENAAMTVMPFVLIIQLVLSGLMFSLPENAEWIKDITISKWGLCSICSSADVDSLPSSEYNKMAEKIEDFDEYDVFDELSEEEKEEFLDSFASSGSSKFNFDATPGHVVSTWFVLILYSFIYGLIGILFLRRVDKDKR